MGSKGSKWVNGHAAPMKTGRPYGPRVKPVAPLTPRDSEGRCGRCGGLVGSDSDGDEQTCMNCGRSSTRK